MLQSKGNSMNHSKAASSLVLLAAAFVVGGCATSRSEIRLPSATKTVAPSTASPTAPVAYIRTVTDAREFEESPKDPSTPSLGFGGAAQATADVKARAIGRKRNTYGKALGDVTLPEGQTVESVIRENLGTALGQAGYRVASDAAQAGPDGVAVDVSIKKFWVWLKPGFWTLTLSADVATDVTIGSSEAKSIQAHSEDSRQMVTDSVWVEIVSAALEDYRKKAADLMKR